MVERQSCKLKVLGSMPSGGYLLHPLEALGVGYCFPNLKRTVLATISVLTLPLPQSSTFPHQCRARLRGRDRRVRSGVLHAPQCGQHRAAGQANVKHGSARRACARAVSAGTRHSTHRFAPARPGFESGWRNMCASRRRKRRATEQTGAAAFPHADFISPVSHA